MFFVALKKGQEKVKITGIVHNFIILANCWNHDGRSMRYGVHKVHTVHGTMWENYKFFADTSTVSMVRITKSLPAMPGDKNIYYAKKMFNTRRKHLLPVHLENNLLHKENIHYVKKHYMEKTFITWRKHLLQVEIFVT